MRISSSPNDGETYDMPVLDKGIELLAQALLGQEFRAVQEFDSFVTFEREGDPLKIQVGPDGSFAAFNGDDELVAEGEGADELYRILVAKTPASPRSPRRLRTSN
jgi:hypothetical protein